LSVEESVVCSLDWESERDEAAMGVAVWFMIGFEKDSIRKMLLELR
jgi:hypothetical protein